jgi:hypothetical protein
MSGGKRGKFGGLNFIEFVDGKAASFSGKAERQIHKYRKNIILYFSC